MNKKRPVIITGIVIIIAISVALLSLNVQTDSMDLEIMDSGSPRAVIIDQLDEEIPNKEFQKSVTEMLKDSGYHVDLFTTDQVTVDLYKNLPSMKYDIIVIRSHSLGDGYIEESSSLFTGEKYSDHKYIKEQFLGYVGRAVPLLAAEVRQHGGLDNFRNDTFFTVGSKMVDSLMVGKFNNSIIILGGCETMQETRLADAFLRRGASEVVGWTGLIDSQNNDNIMIELIKETTQDNVKIEQAVDFINQSIKGRLYYDETKLDYVSRNT